MKNYRKIEMPIINDIKHMVASEIQQNNKENIHGYRSTSGMNDQPAVIRVITLKAFHVVAMITNFMMCQIL